MALPGRTWIHMKSPSFIVARQQAQSYHADLSDANHFLPVCTSASFPFAAQLIHDVFVSYWRVLCYLEVKLYSYYFKCKKICVLHIILYFQIIFHPPLFNCFIISAFRANKRVHYK